MSDSHNPVGYLLLQNTVIFIQCANDVDLLKTQLLGKWHNVPILLSPVNQHDESTHQQKTSELPCVIVSSNLQISEDQNHSAFEITSSKSPSSTNPQPSSRNFAILHCDSTASLTLLSSNIPSFDGTMYDMKCYFDSSTKNKFDETDENRSDAAMLLGTVYTCSTMGYARIETVEIFVRRLTPNTPCKQSELYPYLSNHSVIVDLVITISIPHLEAVVGRETDPSNISRIIQDTQTSQHNPPFHANVTDISLTRKRKRSELDHLPPVVQLLYTLLRSDWKELRSFQNQHEHHNHCIETQSKTSLFPTYLSLTQIYDRIEYTRQQQSNTIHSLPLKYQSPINGLPDDILIHGVAPYLNARSLHSFRCTCKHVYTILQSTVPGLKLQLYPHQVETLVWMEKREAKIGTVDDTLFQAIHGGNLVRLRPRNKPESSFWVMDCTTGKIVPSTETNTYVATVGRGGFCCDAPGTGKTITILSLILRSLGQCTTTDIYSESERKLDDEIFQAYWKDVLTHDMKTSALLQLMKDLRLVDDFRVLLNTFEIFNKFNDIRSRAVQGFYHDDLDLLESDIDECLRCPSESMTSQILVNVSRISQRFCEIFDTFKSLCLKRSAKRKNNYITELMGRKLISDQYSRLCSSKGTLVIVPKALIAHWVNQIKLHVQHSYCCGSKIPIIFRHQKRRRNIRISSSSVESLFYECVGDNEFSEMLTYHGSHQPFLFVDEDPTLPLPSSSFLANFVIVLSSSQRLSNERSSENLPGDEEGVESSNRLCPFLNILWLRLVVDEGHTTGNMSTNSSEMCCQISAERRWCVTGTPTPETKSNDGLKNVLGLLNFIKYDFWNPQRIEGAELWAFLTKSFRKGDLAAFFRLQIVLRCFMARQNKEGITNLFRPELRNALIDMSPNEIASYNKLVSAVQGNILITTMEGKTSGYQDCLLNPLMNTHAQKALNNLRLSCFGGARITPIVKERDIQSVLGLLRDLHSLEDVKVRVIHDLIRRMSTDQVSSCMRCAMNLQTFLLLPCACYLCTECMTNKMTKCPVCGQSFDVDDFQRLQPGIDYNWSWSGEISNLEDRLSPRIINDEEHHCNFLHESSCSFCNSVYSSCPKDETKASYIIEKILSLSGGSDIVSKSITSEDIGSTKSSSYLNEKRGHPVKIIIFSQFRQMLNIIGDRLIRRFGSHCIAEFWGSAKHYELQRFSCVEDCICLLLGKDGAHGLDLSFVTHIIFLDHIMDESVRNQVISRAYRLGASRSVIVEQLVARGTVEELIGKYSGSQTINDLREESRYAKKGSGQLRFLLQNVTLIRQTVPVVKKEEPKAKKPMKKTVRFAVSS